jgi:hypothetical protein
MHYASFLVRLWRSEREATQSGEAWEGELEHIQTSQRATFTSLPELLQLLNRQLEEGNPAERDERADDRPD